jgi:hypothetical protein
MPLPASSSRSAPRAMSIGSGGASLPFTRTPPRSSPRSPTYIRSRRVYPMRMRSSWPTPRRPSACSMTAPRWPASELPCGGRASSDC